MPKRNLRSLEVMLPGSTPVLHTYTVHACRGKKNMDHIFIRRKNKQRIKVKIDSEYSSILHLFLTQFLTNKKCLGVNFIIDN